MRDPIRWGILGTGSIARQFATGLRELPDARLVAVGSRTPERAAAFGAEFDVPLRHGSYAALAADPEIDVVYVATPHACHHADTLLCLRAGKPVLCEKPFALNAGEAAEMIRVARERKLFLMEAMWTRFFPLLQRWRELLAAGVIGEPRLLTADFGFRAELAEEGRLFDRSLGGGALLDVGVYPVSLASLVFGSPTQITGLAQLGATGVDEQSASVLGHAGGGLAVLSSAIRTNTAQEAVIFGTRGALKIQAPWWRPQAMVLTREGQPDETIAVPYTGNGYQYEAAAVMDCLRAGRIESATMPLDETLAILRTLDALRQQWGLVYPGESAVASVDRG